jgi:2-polyprenyl-3-methyl-5-hydroxy-6-metoxy-1,4-benzoquinol methylase
VAEQSFKERQERWRDEASFFDKTAAQIDLQPMHPLTLKRYWGTLHRRFSMEFRLLLLGDLRGKKVLDVGCGEGTNSILLAKLGATVTGIDISSKSIEIAEKRAEINQVAESCRFVCSPLETAQLESNTFDMVWADAILHHIIPEMPLVLGKLSKWAKSDALMVFSEPVNFNQTLRRIRFMLPVKMNATPDERPLEFPEVAVLRRYIPDLQIRHFNLLGRLDRFVLVNYNYERSVWPRRAIISLCARIDSMALSIPGLKRLGGTAVLYGHPSKE